jgi:uncharacterized damage-inducible protein DinB
MRTIAEFLEHYRRQRRWSRALVAAIPPEHFDWSPAADAFRCSDIVRHLMQSEQFFLRIIVSAARGETFDPFHLQGSGAERFQAFRGRNLALSKRDQLGATPSACLEQWQKIQAETERELARISADQLTAVRVTHPLANITAPLWEMLWIMMTHESHHRGQLSAYLKVLKLPQPVLFTDD